MGGLSVRAVLWSAVAAAIVPALTGLGICGCNWKTFADDAKEAPVRSIGAPSSFKAQDFGRSLLPLSDGQGKAAAFVASSINDTNLALVTIDVHGGASAAAVPVTSLNETEQSVLSSLAEDASSSPLTLILGSPKVHNQAYGRVYTYALSPALDGIVTTLAVPSVGDQETGLGRGITTGRLAGADDKLDYVFASDDHVVVMVDGSRPTAVEVSGAGCSTAFDLTQDARYRLRRPLLAARLWADPAGATLQQVVASSPHTSITPGSGTLSLFSVTGMAPAFELTCLANVTAPAPEMRPRFGASLAAGDFNGDGAADLLVGAPGQHAYVYFGPFPAGGFPTPVTIAEPAGVDFGYAVTALNVDGNPGDEALIADPNATVDGKERAGQVTAYSWRAATGTMVSYKIYADHSPTAGQNFGWTVNPLSFCVSASSPPAGTACAPADAARILMIGAANEVFVYYREGANITARDGRTVADVRAP